MSRVVRNDVLWNVLLMVALVCLLSVCVVFALSRVLLFQDRLAALRLESENNAWLVEQCRDDTFYHNMKHHSSLCDEVEAQQRLTLWVEAVRYVVQRTHLCGDVPCQRAVEGLASWVAGPGLPLTCFLALVLLMLPTLCVPLVRAHCNRILRDRAERMHHSLYQPPPYRILCRDLED